MKQLRNLFVTGLLVLVPVMATVDIILWLIRSLDTNARHYLPDIIFKFDFPGMGLLIALAAILLIGLVARNYFGSWFLETMDHLLKKVAIVGGIYGAIKKVLETVFNPKSDQFNGVVLLEFPRAGIYSIGFRTGKPDSKLPTMGKNLVNIFVPCTPNPTSGFYVLVPETDLTPLSMTVQEAFSIIISMGMVTTEDEVKA